MTIEPQSPQDEIYEFLLSKPTLEQIIAFHPSEAAQERLRYLLDRNKTDQMSKEEQLQLDNYLYLEHFMRMLKIKAHEKLT